MTEMDTKLLEAAREKVAKGWMQGAFGVGENYCAIGALASAQAEIRAYQGLPYGHALDRLLAHLPDFGNYPNVMRFNDNPDTTQEMVIALFDKAIADEGV